MTEKYITSSHIQKLAHEIQEIRERALLNIKSKLDHGFSFDNDLARSKEILSKLFDWFLFEPCTKQELVFTLIKRILKSPSGQTLLKHRGGNVFKKDIKQLRTYIEPKYLHHLDEIWQILDQSGVIVPPLETNVPLSYRTGQSDSPVGTTATTIEGFVQQDASAHQKNTPPSDSPNFTYIIHPLKWQFLIDADRHVLQSIEDSLKNPPQPASLLHSAEFFSNILLHDFPAEIFLQRPSIVFSFHDLIRDCPSTRIINSVLHGLIDLTKALKVRINHYNDPCLYTTKEKGFLDSKSSTPNSTLRKSGSGQSDTYSLENVDFLKTQQISFPHYCFTTLKCIFRYLSTDTKKPNQKGTNLALILLDEILKLLSMLFGQDIWNEQLTPLVHEIRKQMNDILIGYSSTLEHLRVGAHSNDSEVSNRVIHLCFLQNFASFLTKFVPLSQTGLILPKSVKVELTDSLVDVTLSKLYPDLYSVLLNFVQSFKVGLDSDSLVKYNETRRLCHSMTSAVEFLKHKHLSPNEQIKLAKDAIPSLEFHKDLNFVKDVIDLCATRFPPDGDMVETFEIVVLKLLSHNLNDIKQETYGLCQKRVIAAIGPRFNTSRCGAPFSHILFLCRANVLTEIACHGMTSDNPQIRNCAEDILIHLIKCKILVSEDIWSRILEALIGSLPILLSHANKNSSLGRNLLNIIDPDTAQSVSLPVSEVLKANINLLFNGESSMREEAFSRLCWLLAGQNKSSEMLPRLNNLYDKALPNVCQLQRLTDINKNRTNQHFYQPSSLQQVLDLLKSPNVEPVIRRSALTQISVMMEDSLLHSTFLINDGLEVILNVMKASLIEKNFLDYPDSVIPAVAVLKNICLYQSSARQEICDDIDAIYNILRSLFLFFTEEKLRQDCVILLFLLVFHHFIKGSPSKATLSVPYLLTKQLKVPFVCNTHWEISKHYEPTLIDLMTSDRWCLSSLQIQWNCEIFGLENLINFGCDDESVPSLLKLNDYDLATLKASSVDFCVKRLLVEVQNGTGHESVIDSVNKLTMYVHLALGDLRDQAWESTFARFLKILPSGEEDVQLLGAVLRFLKLLVPFYKSSDGPFWLSQILKNPNNSLLDLIMVEQSTSEDLKGISQDLMSLIIDCASQEQHFLDYYINSNALHCNVESWRYVIELIVKSLQFSENTHFYNLSYLDALLSCLVHLTATLGWTETKPGAQPKKIVFELVNSLCELIVVFHCGKGPTATISVMGLSITRNVILVLNHLIAEMQSHKVKNWEKVFIDVEADDWLNSFMLLWSSRDTLIRAGALQFFAGLASSPLFAVTMVTTLKLLDLGLTLLMEEEACVVRENCAFLLANLISHTCKQQDIFEQLRDFSFFNRLAALLNNNVNELVAKSEDSFESEIVTPSFVKSLVTLLLSLFNLDGEFLSQKLQDNGLVKILFKCVSSPCVTINDTKKLALYCDILEMNAAICMLLAHIANVHFACLGTLMHTKDCLVVLVSLLNPALYHTNLPQLVFLRNKLWSEIFKLLSVLTTQNIPKEALDILTETIVESGRETFIQTVCESTNCSAFNDLQSSALLSLTSLLNAKSENDTPSLQNLLDTVRSNSQNALAGAEICKILLNLFDLCHLKTSKELLRKKSMIVACLSSVLGVSTEAKNYAFDAGLPTLLVKHLKDFGLKLSLESVDCLRRVLEKKRVCPLLQELDELIGLLTNFMFGDERVKNKFAQLGLSDFIHKLWVWFALQNAHLLNVLKLICTFTSNCALSCQSLPLTSSVAGSGPRKIPTKVSLLHVVINVIDKEMDLVSRTHTLDVLNLCFNVLKNCCAVLECRLVLSKSILLQSISRLHPAITKKQKPWDQVELLWLEFLQVFTLYPEGQSNIAKVTDVFDLLVTLSLNSKLANRKVALTVLRNVAFYQPNRSRLLTSDDFINLLRQKLESGSEDEKTMVTLMMWSLAANNQKAKIVFKAAQLDSQLQLLLKHYQLTEFGDNDEIGTVKYVLNMIRDNDS